MNATSVMSGNVHFWGVIDSANPFTTVTIAAPDGLGWRGEGIAIDDVYIGTAALAVPKPSSILLLSSGLLLLLRRKTTIGSGTREAAPTVEEFRRPLL